MTTLMLRSRLVAIGMAMGLGIVACESHRDTAPEQSLGSPERPKWMADLELHVGAEADAIVFSRISDVAVSEDGVVAVVQPQEGHVLVLDDSARFVRTLGGRGGGPGEFRWDLQRVGFRGDSIWASDSCERTHFFGPDGGVRTRVSTLAAPEPFFLTSICYSIPQGTIVALGSVFAADIDDASPGFTPFFHYTHDGVLLNSIPGPGNPRVVTLTGPPLVQGDITLPTQVGVRVPHTQSRWADLNPTTGEVAVAWYEQPPTPGHNQFRFALLTPTADTVYEESAPYVSEAFPEAYGAFLMDSIVEAIAASFSGEGPARRALEAHSRGIPAHAPPISEVFLDDDRRVWFRLVTPATLGSRGSRSSSSEWLIFQDAAEGFAHLELPSRFTPFDAAGEVVWGVFTDDFGVPYLRKYRLRRE